jgi:hypothetical protein
MGKIIKPTGANREVTREEYNWIGPCILVSKLHTLNDYLICDKRCIINYKIMLEIIYWVCFLHQV